MDISYLEMERAIERPETEGMVMDIKRTQPFDSLDQVTPERLYTDGMVVEPEERENINNPYWWKETKPGSTANRGVAEAESEEKHQRHPTSPKGKGKANMVVLSRTEAK